MTMAMPKELKERRATERKLMKAAVNGDGEALEQLAGLGAGLAVQEVVGLEMPADFDLILDEFALEIEPVDDVIKRLECE